jgi:hypothetical protein
MSDGEGEGEKRGALDRLSVAIAHPAVAGSALVAAALLLSAWFLEYRLPPSDEGAILTQAAKILDGGVYYRDIDAYALPGASYLLALAMALFGEHLSVARWVAALVYVGILVGVWANARQLVGARRAVLVGASMLAFKFLAWPGLTAYFYFDVAFCFACASVALFVGHERARTPLPLFLAGLCASLALLSKQTVGLYLAVASTAILLFSDPLLGAPRRPARSAVTALSAYLGGLALPVFPTLAYFAAHGILGRMLHSGFIRPLTTYLPTSGVSFAVPLRWWQLGEIGPLEPVKALGYIPEPYWQLLRTHRLPGEALQPLYWLLGELSSRALYTSIPLAFIAAAALWLGALRRDPPAPERKLLIFAALAFAVFLSAFPRADFPHVISVFPLVMVLLFGLGGRLAARLTSPALRRALRGTETATVTLVLLTTLLLAAWQHSFLTHRIHLERATLRVSPDHAYAGSVVRYVSDEVAPGESIFVFVHEAYYYFLTDRYSPWPFAQLYPGMAGGDGGRALAAMLERQPPRLVIAGQEGFPGLPPLHEYAPAVPAWVHRNFVLDLTPFVRYPLPVPTAYARVFRPRYTPGR